MSIDLRTEQIYPLREIADLPCLPRRRRGARLHVSTLIRWCTTGVRGVRLEALRVGGTLCTSVQALQRFFDRLSRNAAITPTGATTSDQDRYTATEQQLDELGIRGPAVTNDSGPSSTNVEDGADPK